jgi:AraC-like DNA-binding protein
VHTLKIAPPRPELRPFVRAYAQRNTGARDPIVVEPVPAQLEQILVFELGNPYEIRWPTRPVQKFDCAGVAGGQTQFAAHMHLPAGVGSFGIFFHPTGFSHLFAVPAYSLTDCVHDAVPVLGRFVRSLWNRLGEAASFEDRVRIVEQFLLHRASRASNQEAIEALASCLFHKHGAVRIADLARLGPLGLRQFERRFSQEMGVTPKVFARIARFQAALDAKVAHPQRTWLDIAHWFGYYDQMHMIHDFEQLGKNTPTQLIAELRDCRPAALASASQEIIY